jgi:hypothetical protein
LVDKNLEVFFEKTEAQRTINYYPFLQKKFPINVDKEKDCAKFWAVLFHKLIWSLCRTFAGRLPEENCRKFWSWQTDGHPLLL